MTSPLFSYPLGSGPLYIAPGRSPAVRDFPQWKPAKAPTNKTHCILLSASLISQTTGTHYTSEKNWKSYQNRGLETRSLDSVHDFASFSDWKGSNDVNLAKHRQSFVKKRSLFLQERLLAVNFQNIRNIWITM